MAKYNGELFNDGKFIFINTPYAEAYIPDDIFDNPNEDPRPSSLAYDTGEYIVTIGIFYMRYFDSDENANANRDKIPLKTLCYPNKIETRPSGNTTRETLTLNGVTDVYRVYRYYKGDILMESKSRQSYINTEMFTKLVMAGKLPTSLTYDDLYFSWFRCFQINGIDKGIPPVLQQGIISEMARNPDNPAEQFRKIAGKQKVDPHGYKMFSMNQVSAYSSVMSSMSFERYAEKLTTSLIMTKEGIEQKQSPIERIITI